MQTNGMQTDGQPVPAPALDALPDDLISPTQAARLLPGSRPGKGVHIATIYRLIADGRIRSWRRGRQRFVSAAEVRALIQPVPPRKTARHVPEPTRRQQEDETSRILRRFKLE